MAKKNENENPEANVTDLTPEANPSKEKEVRVRGLVNHKCTIGSTPVIIEKGQEQKLPAGIAMILQGADKVAILV